MDEEAGHALRDGEVLLTLVDDVLREPWRVAVRSHWLVVAEVLRDDRRPVHVVYLVGEELAEHGRVVDRPAGQQAAEEQLLLIPGRVRLADPGVIGGRRRGLRSRPDRRRRRGPRPGQNRARGGGYL